MDEVIRVKNLEKSYGTVPAVGGVDFTIGAGEIVGLLGPNGAGKTTILKILTGYHYPGSGEASVLGESVVENPRYIRSSIGYLPENTPLYTELTVREYLEFIAAERNIPAKQVKGAIEKAASECGIGKIMDKTISQLSKGYRQRTGLAGAVIHSPQVLILDEPTAGLDPNQIREIRRLIRRIGSEKTVILSTHILQEVEAVCSRVIILNRGIVVSEGTTESVRRQAEGRRIYTLAFDSTQKLQQIKEELLQHEGVHSVLSVERGEDVRAEVELRENYNGGTLFSWAVTHGTVLKEMHEKRSSLEDVFESLTMDREDENGVDL